ncbi:Arylsulfatase [Stieleria neptunia]|uniref:Arylsulfatase n=1 Tax=Stieleria neptunia TaxID=2527979 RepID=A0A518HIC0_9BACT|nr:sulfatase [Stieleria neptunia]QDV40601.1 Arylsulfatase [Stieleria neptunia]
MDNPFGAVRRISARLLLGVVAIAIALPGTLNAQPNGSRPNVLLIAIDDMNDWPGFMQRYPDAITPNMDQLAQRGVVFDNAHCAYPLCGPSRASIFTGMSIPTLGGYRGQFKDSEVEELAVEKGSMLLHGYFKKHGYKTMAVGKLLHRHVPKGSVDLSGGRGDWNRLPDGKRHWKSQKTMTDWGPYPGDDTEMSDYKAASWATERLDELHEEPFLLMVGFLRPHVPWHVPQEWFDLYPDPDKITLPPYLKNDLADVPDAARETINDGYPRTEWAKEEGNWKEILHSYLACLSFVDAQVGRVLTALDESPYKDNTIIVLWSDHGYHLGEKNTFQKHTTWERSSRTPLIISGPEIQAGRSSRVVSLLDLYPTLLDMCGLPENSKCEGRSLQSLLEDPQTPWPYPAIIHCRRGHAAVQTETHRYIRYEDGTEELYDHTKDPNEWTNLADMPEQSTIKDQLGKHLEQAGQAANDSKPRSKSLLRVDFDGDSDDEFAKKLLKNEHNELAKGKGPDGSDTLRTEYVGYDRGSERVVVRLPLGKAVEQATLSYDVCFEEGFQWVRSGKLHGLGPARPITGGRPRKPDGWSARMLFKSRGRCATYLYEQSVEKTFGVGKTSKRPVFTPGKWHHVSMQVSVNTPGKEDGFVRFSVDGEPAVESRSIEFRGANEANTLIELFLFSTFHGGSSPSFAPKDQSGNYVTVHAMFDNFEVIEGIE